MKRVGLFAAMAAVIWAGACHKSGDMQVAKPEPGDTTKIARSPNCIDSVIGVYYGRTTSWTKSHSDADTEVLNSYDGLDTLTVSKVNDSVMNLQSSHSIGMGHYKFDSSDVVKAAYNGVIYLFPKNDSISQQFNLESGDSEDGTSVFSRFYGRK